MDLYFVILRFSKYISNICVVLLVSLLIFVYFGTLNRAHTRETFDLESSPNRKVLLSTLDKRIEKDESLDERIERDEYAVNRGKEPGSKGEEPGSRNEKSSSANYLLSLDPDITKRGKWQRKQINNYCQKHGLERYITDDYHDYQHLLYDDSKKIVFCYVPKVGCSKWKYTFLLLNGIISFTTKRLPESVLKKTKKLSDLPTIERKRRLVEYYKYVFVRNPMERIVSAYKNKIAKPLNLSLVHSKFEEAYKVKVLKTMKPEEYSKWLKSNKKVAMYPTFSEFIQYLSMENLKKVNEHFQPVIHLCHPCAINYNFFGNFKLLPRDADTLVKQFNLNSSYYDSQSYISHKLYNTSDLVPKYFSGLTDTQKEALFYLFADELEFYYSLYPEEKDNHLNL